MVQDEPDVADMNEGTFTPSAAPQAPSFETPSMATDLPLTDLATVDPIAAMIKYMLSLSTWRLKY